MRLLLSFGLMLSIASAQFQELTSPLSQDIEAQSVRDVLSRVRAETKAEVYADAKMGNRLVTARMAGRSSGEFLRAMAEALKGVWVAEGKSFYLRPDPSVEKAEAESWWAVQKRNEEDLWGQILVLKREAARPLPELIQEFEVTFLRLKTLREQKPTGWSEEYHRLNQRMDEVLRPFAARPLLHMAINEVSLTDDFNRKSLASGGVYSRILKNGEWICLFSDPTSGKVHFGDRNGIIPLLESDSPLEPELPPFIRKPNQDAVLSDASIIVQAVTDQELLAQMASKSALPVVVEALRSREILGAIAGHSVRHSFDFLKNSDHDWGFTSQGWVTFRPKRALWHRQANPPESLLQSIEKSGPHDLRALVSFVMAMNGSSLAVVQPQIASQINWWHFRDHLPLFELLGRLSPAQFDGASKGQSIPWHSLAQPAQQIFNFHLNAPEKPAWLLAKSEDPFYFYLERYGSPLWRSSDKNGKSVSGGINDGAENAFKGVEQVQRDQLYRYELNYYFGHEFARSIKRTLVIESKVAPPTPKNDPKAAPPDHHEGHGPGK